MLTHHVPRLLRPVGARALSTPTARERTPVLRRAMLYVPGSNPRMLEKSLASPADSVSYDLEDAVAPSAKPEARRLVSELLDGDRRPKGELMARINAVGTPWAEDDLDSVLRTRNIEAVALPKTNDPEHIEWVVSRIKALCPPEKQANGATPLRVIGMIETAEAMLKIKEIAASGKGHLDALLVSVLYRVCADASLPPRTVSTRKQTPKILTADCADVGIVRTPSRAELLYHRSKLVVTAKAFGLGAIDLVCVNYKDPEAVRLESEEGRTLGFTGKQAIHPSQIDVIQRAFAPSDAAILKAARIKFSFELNERLGRGAYGLDGVMIDAPVYKQALVVLANATAAKLPIPEITEKDVS